MAQGMAMGKIQALVDKKKVIITETSIRSDLKLDDAKGTDCLPTATIFAELERMGYGKSSLKTLSILYKAYFSSPMEILIHSILQCLNDKTTSLKEFSSVMASCYHMSCQSKNFNFTKFIFDYGEELREGFHSFETLMVQAIKTWGKDSATPTVSYFHTHSYSNHLYINLKRNVKKETEEKDSEVTLVDETQEMNDDNLLFDIGVLEEQEKEVAEKEVSVVDLVTTAGEIVTSANVEVTTVNAPTTTIDELTRMFDFFNWPQTSAKENKQEQLSIEEKSRLFVELLERRKKYFAALIAQEKRSKPPTKAQKRNTMSTYLKNMGGYKHNQLKSKRSDNSKKQKINEYVEAKKDDDQEEAEMKNHIEIVKDDEVSIDDIPLATKPPVIVKYKIVKEGKDLETLWKLVKVNMGIQGNKDDMEEVLWGDMKVMFEPDIKK
ncbi:hypothetical protein Tco_0143637 [Tanacetum coccineum]